MVQQYISGLKKKRETKQLIPKAKKPGTTGKRGQVFQNNLMNTDYTGGPTTSRKLKRGS